MVSSIYVAFIVFTIGLAYLGIQVCYSIKRITIGYNSHVLDSSQNVADHNRESCQKDFSRAMNRVAIRHFLMIPFLFAAYWFGDLKTLWIIIAIMFALSTIQKAVIAYLSNPKRIEMNLDDLSKRRRLVYPYPDAKRSLVIARAILQFGLLVLWIYSWRLLIL